MRWFVVFVIALAALHSTLTEVVSESLVYACNEVTKRDPVDVQKLCERERKGKWWMN